MIATRRGRAGYGRFAAAIVYVALASPIAGRASSVGVQSVRFGQAVTMSARVVKGTVKARAQTKIDGATLHYVELAVDAVLKGPAAKAGERIRVFDGAEWFRHTHAAAIKGGVVSYVDARYATPVPDAQLEPGAPVIVFLRGESPPPGFPPDAAFLSSSGAFERPARAADVARMKTAAFGDPITLAMGDVAVLPDGLEVEIKAHTHKRPMAGGPQKEIAELEVRSATRSERVALGHLIEPGTPPKETWPRRTIQLPAGPQYDLVLVGMKRGAETTLRVLRRSP